MFTSSSCCTRYIGHQQEVGGFVILFVFSEIVFVFVFVSVFVYLSLYFATKCNDKLRMPVVL